MTISEMWRTVRLNLRNVLIFSIVCALAATGFIAFTNGSKSEQHTMVARVISNGYSYGIASFVSDQVRDIEEQLAAEGQNSSDTADFKIEWTLDKTPNTVGVEVTSKDMALAESMANEIAETALRKAEGLYEGWENPLQGQIIPAREDKEANKGIGKVMMAVMALATFVGGFVMASAAAILLDSRKRRILRAASITDALYDDELTSDPDGMRVREALERLPILDELPAEDGGKKLLANTRFAAEHNALEDVRIVPLGDGAAADLTARTLVAAVQEAGDPSIRVSAMDSVQSNIEVVYSLASADAVIISIKLWEDTLDQLTDTLRELTLAKVNLAGLVLVK